MKTLENDAIAIGPGTKAWKKEYNKGRYSGLMRGFFLLKYIDENMEQPLNSYPYSLIPEFDAGWALEALQAKIEVLERANEKNERTQLVIEALNIAVELLKCELTLSQWLNSRDGLKEATDDS